MTHQVHVHVDVLSMCMRSIDWPSLMESMEMVSSLASDEDNELPKTCKNLFQKTLSVIPFKLGRQVRGSYEPMKIHNCVQLGSQLLGYLGQAAIYDYLHCYDINKAKCLCAFIKANKLLLGQDSHRAKKVMRVILLVMIITVSTLQVMLQTMLVKCLEVQTLSI